MDTCTKDIFKKIEEERGGLAQIHAVFHDFPQAAEAHYEFYKAMILSENLPLTRLQREALAYFTSESNVCHYCVGHHRAAYAEQLKFGSIDEVTVRLFAKLAESLSKGNSGIDVLETEFVKAGFSKAQWLHSIIVVSYFNMANRIAFATNIKLEEDFQDTCN
jgi:alkylhydroperoxidase family enzyme